ncbi:hypothetical protein C8Q75DRAFT_881942 [Abortiporus biennis]|nr:hypothetical protein C8Q75DRAFT_881942 [Abortiporus biennis]
MNHLLRTFTEIQSKSSEKGTDLKLLLSTVKEARRLALETRASDAFYDSLEALLHDLRTVTIDNNDAEPFNKPVAKSDVPDYHTIIAHPMDLQQMLKKVKAKQYKSKREFQDDLDLIWSNCYTYNANPNHPLRKCADRLKAKSEILLKYVTDRKDRQDPPIPGELSRGVTPKTNGIISNGISKARPTILLRTPSPSKSIPSTERRSRRDAPFLESYAITRSAAGMSTFLELDRELDQKLNAALEMNGLGLSMGEVGGGVSGIEERLREFIVPLEDGEEKPDVSSLTEDGETGEKRKLNGTIDGRPRKRLRTTPEPPKDPVELWWDAMRSDEMIANGVPVLRYAASENYTGRTRESAIPVTARKKGKKKKVQKEPVNTMLYHMNNNIRTMRRVRTTHAKFAVLNQANDESGINGGIGGPPPPELMPPPEDDIDDVLDERPWRIGGSGIEIGEKNASDCLQWMGSKVLEHVGFQGTSKAALDVLTSVTSEYLLNVGRTIRYLTDKYGNRMTAEEIILHTLFESGTTRIVELERYIKDDVLRHGARLLDLEKKLTNAYREATTVEAWDDDALFRDEEEEEDSEFVMGNFADSFGDDFLGLRELGIAQEFGLSTLTIPKKLLKGKTKAKIGPSTTKPTEPPPPFPPPPPFIPLDSTNVDEQIGLLKPYYQSRISSQSMSVQPASNLPGIVKPEAGLPPTAFSNLGPVPYPPMPKTDEDRVPQPPAIVVPDDLPTPSHAKLGPLGQILKPSNAAASSKKKSSASKGQSQGPNKIGPGMFGSKTPSMSVDAMALSMGVPMLSMDGDNTGMYGLGQGINGYPPIGMEPATPSSMSVTSRMESESPKKPKNNGTNGVGGGGSKKKKGGNGDPLPPVVMASA